MMFAMDYCVIIIDGASGWPLEELGGRTTLAAARTPNLDRLAGEGMVGLARTVPEGAEPSSAAACMSILGYDPVADFVGRGAIEAAAVGVGLGPGDVALRMNLVTVRDGVMVSYSAGHISTEESAELVAELASALGEDSFSLHAGVAYRHLLVVRDALELLEADYTAPHDISDRSVAGKEPSGPGTGTLLALMERARPVLAASPVNAARLAAGESPATDIWPFWPGARPEGMTLFAEGRRKTAALTSGVDLLGGLAELTGIDRLDIAGVTDGPDNDYAAQAEGGLAALGDHDLVVIHVESPDEAGHAGDAAAKVAAIEAIDREVVGRALDRADTRILAMPDHPTPVSIKTHVGEPVPFVLWGPGVEPGSAAAFDEASAVAERVLVDPGRGVMDLLLGG